MFSGKNGHNFKREYKQTNEFNPGRRKAQVIIGETISKWMRKSVPWMT